MRLRRIAKSRRSKAGEKRGDPIVAHLATEGTFEPLCQTSLPRHARWLEESDSDYVAERECKNCDDLACRMGVR